MTLMEVMEHLAALIREAVRDYAAEQPSGLRPVEVYAGYPPVPENAAEKSSFIWERKKRSKSSYQRRRQS